MVVSIAAQGQTMIYEDDAVAEVYGWLEDGQTSFQVLEKDLTPEFKEVYDKYQKSIIKNKDWFRNFKEKYKEMSPLPYHENFGLTEAEYDKMNKDFLGLKMRVKTTKTVEVIKEGDKISFKGADDFRFLDMVSIDKEKNTVLINDAYNAKFIGQVYQSDSEYGGYAGYKWKYEKGNYEAVMARQDPDYYSYEITFAKTMPSGKVLVLIEMLAIERLNTKVDAMISGYMVKNEK